MPPKKEDTRRSEETEYEKRAQELRQVHEDYYELMEVYSLMDKYTNKEDKIHILRKSIKVKPK